MKKIKCHSVRYKELIEISDKAVLIKSFDGSKDLIPISQIFSVDYDPYKSDAIWVAAWILKKKNIQYSSKKVAWFNEEGEMLPSYKITKHVPEKAIVEKSIPDVSLVK